MLGESLLALAILAGQVVVDAAAADEWETAQRGFAHVLGYGDAKQTRLTEQRLEETREQVIGAAGTDAGLVRAALAVRWAERLADLLEENPDAEADLRALVQQIQAAPTNQTPSGSDGAVWANGDVGVNAAGVPEPEHPGALAARSELAYSIGQAGDAAAARDQFAALLPVAERVLGPEHPDALAARASLAYWTGQAGDAATARDLFAALLPVAERVLGPEHPDTLTNRHNLANFAGYAGDAATARDQFAALLPVSERILGTASPVPWPPAPAWPTGPGRPGMQPPHGTNSPRCYLSGRACLARTIPTVWRHGRNLPTGQDAPAIRLPRGTSSPRCCRLASGSEDPSTPRPWPSGISLPIGLPYRGTKLPRGTSLPRSSPGPRADLPRMTWISSSGSLGR